MDMYVSDTHFGHTNVLRQCRPQFSSVEEMNETIIKNINDRMKKSDTLYIVGDFAYRSKRPIVEYLEAIKPKKVLIVGNHDRDWLRHLDEEELGRQFVGIYQQFSLKKNGIELHFNHYPQLAWNRSHYFGQSFSICGHIHNAGESNLAARLFPQVRCQFNAGVDINGFQPVTFAELVANNTAFYRRVYTPEEQALLDTAIEKIMA